MPSFTAQMIDTILKKLGRRRIQGKGNVDTRTIAGTLNRGDNEIQSFGSMTKIWRKTALIANIGVLARVLQCGFQSLKNFSPHPQRIGKAAGAHRHDHKLLKINGIVSMRPTIDDVHHRHRQYMRKGAADITI